MRATGQDVDLHKQRRRRFVAAVLCLGTLAAAVVGTFLTERRSVQGHAAADPVGTVSAVPTPSPSPQPLGSQPAAYPLASGGTLSSSQLAALHPSSSGTAGPTAVSPVPTTPGSPDAKSSGVDDGSLLAGMAPAAPPPSMTVSNPLSSTAFGGLPQVGAIFDSSGGATGSHYCTGSVVSSQPGDIVITAAHCVYDSSSGSYLNSIAFAPGYHDGQQPYGLWTPSKILVPQQWIDSGDPDYDVAFVVVHQSGTSSRIQDQVGADQLGLNPSYTGLAQVVGYPGATEQPVTCTNYTKQLSATQLEFDCPGFPDGTSGGPFLADVDQQTGQGTVVGVIGGYETGGDTPDVSYSTYFGSAVADLFSQAEAAG